MQISQPLTPTSNSHRATGINLQKPIYPLKTRSIIEYHEKNWRSSND